jgi:general stress protein YciG
MSDQIIVDTTVAVPTKSKRGFGGMSPERRKAISSLGGKAVKPENRSFSQSRELAQTAGSKGGKVPRKKATDHGTNPA